MKEGQMVAARALPSDSPQRGGSTLFSSSFIMRCEGGVREGPQAQGHCLSTVGGASQCISLP